MNKQARVVELCVAAAASVAAVAVVVSCCLSLYEVSSIRTYVHVSKCNMYQVCTQRHTDGTYDTVTRYMRTSTCELVPRTAVPYLRRAHRYSERTYTVIE